MLALSDVFFCGPAATASRRAAISFFVEQPHGAGGQVAQADGADGDACEPLHFVADAGEQAADFAIAAFVEHHLEERAVLLAALDPHVLRLGEAFGQVHALVELVLRPSSFDWPATWTSYVFSTPWRGCVRPLASSPSLVTMISPSLDMSSRPTQYARGASGGIRSITRGRPEGSLDVETTPSGLLTAKYDELGLRQDFAIDADLVRKRIDAGAELGDDLAIDFDATVEDHLLALAAAGDAGSGENFLQTLACLRHVARPVSAMAAGAGVCAVPRPSFRGGVWILVCEGVCGVAWAAIRWRSSVGGRVNQ